MARNMSNRGHGVREAEPLVRFQLPIDGGNNCWHCKERPAKFKYGIHQRDGSIAWDEHEFCSKLCYKEYRIVQRATEISEGPVKGADPISQLTQLVTQLQEEVRELKESR